ncbi:hypothetical protein ACJX0J_031384, partial [Zea mays]
ISLPIRAMFFDRPYILSLWITAAVKKEESVKTIASFLHACTIFGGPISTFPAFSATCHLLMLLSGEGNEQIKALTKVVAKTTLLIYSAECIFLSVWGHTCCGSGIVLSSLVVGTLSVAYSKVNPSFTTSRSEVDEGNVYKGVALIIMAS